MEDEPQVEWECVGYSEANENNGIMTFRCAVPGGWLVAVRGAIRFGKVGSMPTYLLKSPEFWGGLTYYPDPEHSWGDFVCPTIDEVPMGFRSDARRSTDAE